MNATRPFGVIRSKDSARDIVSAAVQQTPIEGVALGVTPNIDYIQTIRRPPGLARAYLKAARIVCDGWPVQLYARFCGIQCARAGLEWSWRLGQEPQRLMRRYAIASVGFGFAVIEDQFRNLREGRL